MSSDSRDSTRAWKIAPKAAIPVATPSCRKVLLMPDAMPLRVVETTPTAVDTSDGLTAPIPAPTKRKPASSAVHSEWAVTPCISARPRPQQASPTPMIARTGTTVVSLPAIGATANASSVIGSTRTPVSSGEKPSTFWR